MTRIVVVRDDGSDDGELLATLRACSTDVRLAASAEALREAVRVSVPDVVVVELDEPGAAMVDVAAQLPDSVRVIVIGDPRALPQAAHIPAPACVLFPNPDEDTVSGALTLPPRIDADLMVRELLELSVFGADRATTLETLATRLARAFAADDCLVLLPEEATCFTARGLSDDAVADLAPLCETVCQFATTVIAPPRPGRPYRAFLGMPLALNNAPPVALVLLCRERPLPFGRDARAYLRGLADRLAVDLSWRFVHERLLADRDKLRAMSRIDPVLGVANRAALQDELSRRVAGAEQTGEPFCVAVIDVDGLRLINERNGYPAGDAVLAHVAQVARLETGPLDIVARYAGDAVAIGLPGATPEAATETLTRILSAIDATPVQHEDSTINLTVSAGIAELHSDVDTGEGALARAMAARDLARRTGEVIRVADTTTVPDQPMQPDFEIGRTLGGVYQIRHEISRGSFGVVYRAEDLALGRQVALKLLRPDLARDTSFVEGFRREAATLARIRNPNLVQVYSFGIEDASVYFAMELVEGQGLDARIISARRRRRHLAIPEVIRSIDEVANALEAVHRAGMLHRDVKPENVLVDRINRRCVLVDVGIAVRRGEKNPAGTPGFTAPEVFGNTGETPSTDVYSLGALAYLLLTLELPFVDATPADILHLQQTRRPRTLTSIRGDLPPEVDAIVLASLDPDPARRPQSARELARALADALARPSVHPRQTIERVIVPPPQRRVTSHSGSHRTVEAVASTRGVLFRSVYEVLGARRGAAWLADVCHRLPELAAALSPHGSALAWHPTTAFITLLESLGTDDDDRHALAFQLGKSAIESSFGQFYGADLSAVSPAQVLGAADLYLRSYHTWCKATATATATTAQLAWTDGVPHRVLCASMSGLLAGMVGCAGGHLPRVDHPTCRAAGAERCAFFVSWSTTDDLASMPTVGAGRP